jgi:hypothetical protein
VVSFTLLFLYSWERSSWYSLYNRLSGPQSRSGRYGEEIKLFLIMVEWADIPIFISGLEDVVLAASASLGENRNQILKWI